MPAWQWLIDLSKREDLYGNSMQRWLIALGIALAVGPRICGWSTHAGRPHRKAGREDRPGLA